MALFFCGEEGDRGGGGGQALMMTTLPRHFLSCFSMWWMSEDPSLGSVNEDPWREDEDEEEEVEMRAKDWRRSESKSASCFQM